MEFKTCSSSVYFVAILLMQMPVSISAQFMVHGTVEPLVVTLGEQVEIHCHISPPQSAAHMEVRWFRDRYTQPVYLYHDGEDLYGEVLKDYVERTQLLKESIEEGNVTVRIQNVVASDAGEYHCLFKDGDFSEEAIVEIKVAAVGLEIQFNVNATNTKKIMVECNSGGWFPKPQIQWRDTSGQIISPSSELYSQDKSELFHVSTVLVLNISSQSATCYLQNPITGQEKWTKIQVEDTVFPKANYWEMAALIISSCMLLSRYVYFVYLQSKYTGFLNRRIFLCKEYYTMFCVFVILMILQVVYLHIKKDHPSIANIISNSEKLIICTVIMLYVSMTNFVFYFFLKGIMSSNQDHEGEATQKLATSRSLDFQTTKRRRASI